MSPTVKNWGAITSFPRESIKPTLPFLTTGYRSPPVCAITQIAVVSQTNRLHRRLSSVTELDLRPTLTMDTEHFRIHNSAVSRPLHLGPMASMLAFRNAVGCGSDNR